MSSGSRGTSSKATSRQWLVTECGTVLTSDGCRSLRFLPQLLSQPCGNAQCRTRAITMSVQMQQILRGRDQESSIRSLDSERNLSRTGRILRKEWSCIWPISSHKWHCPMSSATRLSWIESVAQCPRWQSFTRLSSIWEEGGMETLGTRRRTVAVRTRLSWWWCGWLWCWRDPSFHCQPEH